MKRNPTRKRESALSLIGISASFSPVSVRFINFFLNTRKLTYFMDEGIRYARSRGTLHAATFGISHHFTEHADGGDGPAIDYSYHVKEQPCNSGLGEECSWHTLNATKYNTSWTKGSSFHQQGINFQVDQQTGEVLRVTFGTTHASIDATLRNKLGLQDPEFLSTRASVLLQKDPETNRLEDAGDSIDRMFINSNSRSPYLGSLLDMARYGTAPSKKTVALDHGDEDRGSAYIQIIVRSDSEAVRPDMKILATELTREYIAGLAKDDPKEIQSFLENFPPSILDELGIDHSPEGILAFTEEPFSPYETVPESSDESIPDPETATTPHLR